MLSLEWEFLRDISLSSFAPKFVTLPNPWLPLPWDDLSSVLSLRFKLQTEDTRMDHITRLWYATLQQLQRNFLQMIECLVASLSHAIPRSSGAENHKCETWYPAPASLLHSIACRLCQPARHIYCRFLHLYLYDLNLQMLQNRETIRVVMNVKFRKWWCKQISSSGVLHMWSSSARNELQTRSMKTKAPLRKAANSSFRAVFLLLRSTSRKPETAESLILQYFAK
jgi:hypothetical protein